MNSKGRTLLVLLVFVLLLTAAIFLRNPKLFSFLNKSQLIDTSGVTKITISKTVLTKIKDAWVVSSYENFPADQGKTEQLIASISTLNRSSLVSNNPENYSKYGVGEEGIKLTIGDQTLIIGNTGVGFTANNYFRLENSKEVYLSNTSFEPTAKDPEWRNLAISFQPSIAKITIKNSNGEFILEQKDDTWILTQPKLDKVVDARAGDLASRLSSMRAQDATSSGKLGQTAVTISVKGVEGEDSLIIGQEEDNERLAKLDSLPYLYYLAPSDFGVFLDLDKEYFQ